ASLLPFLNLKKRIFGGELEIKALKITHRKTEAGKIPSPPSPSYRFFTLQLHTVVSGGEMHLYDVNTAPQFALFDLDHHVAVGQTCGTISFDWDPAMPKFTTHFLKNGIKLLLSADFNSHSFPIISHLVAYFFRSYLPESSLEWEIFKGEINGSVEMAFL